jgi:carbon storage regulator
MLVLSRRIGEKIVVPACELTITLVAIRGNRVRLGIAAPGDIAVYREEVWLRGEDPAPTANKHMEAATI